MAKKTIISDFSALKGKVTFSEKTSSAKVSPKVTPATATPKPKDSNDGLKNGQSVVLMDSLTIDLHIEAIPGGNGIPKGQQLQFQLETFRKVIRENISHRGMKISFIHGIGDGILKAAIRKELDEVLALRCSYSVGDPAVTVVTIR